MINDRSDAQASGSSDMGVDVVDTADVRHWIIAGGNTHYGDMSTDDVVLWLCDALDAKDRELGEAEYERHDAMSAADMQCRRYQAKLEAVRDLHERVDTNEGSCCNVCRETAHTWYEWPCPTLRALDGE